MYLVAEDNSLFILASLPGELVPEQVERLQTAVADLTAARQIQEQRRTAETDELVARHQRELAALREIETAHRRELEQVTESLAKEKVRASELQRLMETQKQRLDELEHVNETLKTVETKLEAQSKIFNDNEALKQKIRDLEKQIASYEQKLPQQVSKHKEDAKSVPVDKGKKEAANVDAKHIKSADEIRKECQREAEERFQQELMTNIQELNENFKAAMDDIESSHGKELERIRKDYEAQLVEAREQSAHATLKRDELDAKIKAEMEKEIDSVRKECMNDLEMKKHDLAKEHEQIVAKMEEKFANDFNERLRKLEEKYEDDMENAKKALETAEKAHLAAIDDLKAKHQADLSHLMAEHKESLHVVQKPEHLDVTDSLVGATSLREMNKICLEQRAKIDEMEKVIIDLQLRRNDERQAAESRLYELEKKHQYELESLRLDVLSQANDDQIEALVARHKEAVKRLKEEHALELATLKQLLAEQLKPTETVPDIIVFSPTDSNENKLENISENVMEIARRAISEELEAEHRAEIEALKEHLVDSQLVPHVSKDDKTAEKIKLEHEEKLEKWEQETVSMCTFL